MQHEILGRKEGEVERLRKTFSFAFCISSVSLYILSLFLWTSLRFPISIYLSVVWRKLHASFIHLHVAMSLLARYMERYNYFLLGSGESRKSLLDFSVWIELWVLTGMFYNFKFMPVLQVKIYFWGLILLVKPCASSLEVDLSASLTATTKPVEEQQTAIAQVCWLTLPIVYWYIFWGHCLHEPVSR